MDYQQKKHNSYSVIILLEENSDRFPQYVKMLYGMFLELSKPFEIIIIANGTEVFLESELLSIEKELKDFGDFKDNLRMFTLSKRVPQAVCLKAAFNESSGDIIIACGSYQQIAKESLKEIVLTFEEGDFDIISPYRQKRVDPNFNQLQSRVFNRIVKIVTGFHLNDLSCTVRVLRRRVLEETKLYGGMYRFLPIIAAKKGFKFKELPCKHHEERGKTGLYSFSEYLSRILDILTLYFNIRFSRKPLRFFSMLGALFLGLSSVVVLYVFVQKIVWGHPIGGRPVLLLALLLMVLGVQAASVGLLGEMLVFTHGRHEKEYNIEKVI